MNKIQSIHAREVLDSRGHPTVEVDVRLEGGSLGRAIVPSGASTGKSEARELRDEDKTRYDGRGVLKAVGNVRDVLGPALVGMDPRDQSAIDAKLLALDGTRDKSRLGANAILGVSLAAAHAAAAADGMPLYRHLARLNQRIVESVDMSDTLPIPVVSRPGFPQFLMRGYEPKMPLPMTNLISGGAHAGGQLDFQDFLMMPVGAPDYPTGLEWIVRVYRRLGELLHEQGYESVLVGDEGGYGPRLTGARQACDLVVKAIERAGLKPREQVLIALDVASSRFFDGTHYVLSGDDAGKLTSAQMVDYLENLVNTYPIASIEDGLAEEDWAGWEVLTRRLSRKVWLVGDDLFTTNRQRLLKGMERGAGNSVLIKVNQIGTLTETLQAMALARRAGYAMVVSARSGETEDATIADLAVGTAAGQIKIGSVARSERLAKYNRLLRIAEELK